jgi:hypothetical protein
LPERTEEGVFGVEPEPVLHRVEEDATFPLLYLNPIPVSPSLLCPMSWFAAPNISHGNEQSEVDKLFDCGTENIEWFTIGRKCTLSEVPLI